MRRSRTCVALLFALVASACSSSVAVPVVTDFSSEGSAVSEAVAEASSDPTEPSEAIESTTGESAATEVDNVVLAAGSDLNAGADLDLYLAATFGDFEPEQLGSLRMVLSTFCLGLVDADSIDTLTTNTDVHKRILSSGDACDEFDTVSALFESSASPGKATFEDNVEARFGRIVWWDNIDAFFVHADRYCTDPPSPGGPSEAVLQLSLSAEIELENIAKSGECDLPRRGDSGASDDDAIGDSGEETVFSDPIMRTADGEPLDETLYLLKDDQITAVHLGSGASAQLTTLTGSTLSRLGSASVVPSPDGTQFAYAINDSSTESIVAVGPSVGEAKVVAVRLDWHPPVWSLDGRYLFFQDVGAQIMRYEVESGTIDVFISIPDNKGRFEFAGVIGTSTVHQECPDDQCRHVLTDIESGNEIGSVNVTGGDVRVSANKAFVVYTARNELVIFDVTDAGFVERSRTFLSGDGGYTVVSPDGRWLADAGSDFEPIRVAPSGLTDSEQWTPLIDERIEQWIPTLVWSSDSQFILFANEYDRPLGVRMIDFEGTITELPLTGHVIAMVPGDPEGLND